MTAPVTVRDQVWEFLEANDVTAIFLRQSWFNRAALLRKLAEKHKMGHAALSRRCCEWHVRHLYRRA